MILDNEENEDETKCLKDKNRTEETGEQQVEESSEVAEIENDEDKKEE